MGEIGFEEAVELEERFFVEDHVVDLIRREAAGLQHVVDGAGGKAGVVFDAGEPLFLGGRDDFPSGDQAGRAVVVVTGESEDERRGHREDGRGGDDQPRFSGGGGKKQGRAGAERRRPEPTSPQSPAGCQRG